MKPDVRDLLVIGGGGLAAVGLWMIYPPAMFIGLGLALMWLGTPQIPRLRR